MAILTRQTTGSGVTNNAAPLNNAQLDNNFIELIAQIAGKLPLSGGTLTGALILPSAEFTDLGTNGDPGTDDLYVGGYGIQGNRVSPVYVHNHSTGGVRISSNASLGTQNGILVEANQTTVTGLLTATTKSFTIPHPIKPGFKLRYGSLEGPENGVYVRGKIRGNVIDLPPYWTKLVDPDSITVQLTPIGSHQKLYVKHIVDNTVYVESEGMFAREPHCFYYIQAERVDVDKLQVEIE